MTTIISIDPGQRGFYVVIVNGLVTERAPVYGKSDSPVPALLALLNANPGIVQAVVEKAQTKAGQSLPAMFNYGVGFGQILGALEARGIAVALVPPQEWTRKMHTLVQGACEDSPKARSLNVAKRLYPQETFTPQGCRVPHDGLVDAVLIGFYWLWREGWIAHYREQEARPAS